MQNIVDFGTTLQKINVAKSVFVPPCVSKFFGSVREMLYYCISLPYQISNPTGYFGTCLHAVYGF
jgi:hypothetical protein